MAKISVNPDKSQFLDLSLLKSSQKYGIDLFEELVSEIKNILTDAADNKFKIENPKVLAKNWAVSTLEDFFKELNLKLHYTDDTCLFQTLHIKASLRKGIGYTSRSEAMLDFNTAMSNHIFDLEVVAPDTMVQKSSLFKESAVLQAFCKEIVKKVQANKVPKDTLINIKAPAYLVSPIEFALNKAGWGCVMDGHLSISAVSSTYFRNINKIRNGLPEKGKGINFFQLMNKISVEEVLFNPAFDYSNRFSVVAPNLMEPTPVRTPGDVTIVTEDSRSSSSTSAIVVDLTSVVARPVESPTSSVAPEAAEPNQVLEFPTIPLVGVSEQEGAPDIAEKTINVPLDAKKKEKKKSTPEPLKKDSIKTVKPAKLKTYSSTLPFGKVIEFLSDMGLKITANELKREIPVPVLNMANSIINEKQLEYRKVNDFLKQRALTVGVQEPDLLDSLVIFTRALSAKILNEEIIEGFGVDITTISEIREIIYA